MREESTVQRDSSSASPAYYENDIALIESVKGLKSEHADLWRYFEDRASQLGDQLWSIGSWLMAIVGATLVVPFAGGFLTVPSDWASVEVRNRLALGLLAVFGIAFCVYAFFAILDIRKHIEGNWRRAGYARTGQMDPAVWDGRRRHGWNILLAVGGLSLLAFLAMLVLALLG